MQKVLGVSTALTLTWFGLTACAGYTPTEEPAPEQSPPAKERAAAAAAPWIPGFVKDMSVEAEVGQLLVPSVPGRKQAVSLIQKYHVGGFVYFADDTRTPEKTARLSNALQDASDLPLLLGVGDEHTATFLTPVPGDDAVAAAHRPDDAQAIAKMARAEAHAVGITPAYGPVTGTDELRLADRKKVRADGAVEAIKAGADQLIDPPDVGRAYSDLLKAARKGDLSESRLDNAVSRILKVKETRGLFGDTRADPGRAESLVGSDANRAIARAVASHAITLVKNDQELPLHGATVLVAGAQGERLTKALRGAGLHVTNSLRKADAIVLATQDDGKDTAAKVRAVAQRKPVILVALGKPDDLAHLGKASAALAAYSGDEATLDALAQVLTGSLHPTGHLPSSISPTLPAGFGLTL